MRTPSIVSLRPRLELYWGLRDYGLAATVWGGNPRCDHLFGASLVKKAGGGQPSEKQRWQHAGKGPSGHPSANAGAFCLHCGAWRGQLGLEPTVGLFMQNIVEVFGELRRVLKPTGTLFVNIGDTYASAPNGRSAADTKAVGDDDRTFRDKPFDTTGPVNGAGYDPDGGAKGLGGGHGGKERYKDDRGGARAGRIVAGGVIKAKDRIMIPLRMMLALQEDGWWLRDEIVWSKPNPMPSSVTDRTTPSHEMIYMFSKAARYFYDNDAIREPFADDRQGRDYKMPDGWDTGPGAHSAVHRLGREKGRPAPKRLDSVRNVGGRTDGFTKPNDIDPSANGGKNKRSVWVIPTEPFPEAHFATFPTALVEPMILAGTSARGCCTRCGKPWERAMTPTVSNGAWEKGSRDVGGRTDGLTTSIGGAKEWANFVGKSTTGWYPTCKCDGLAPLPKYPPEPEHEDGEAIEVFEERHYHWRNEEAAVSDARAALLAAAMPIATAKPIVLDPFGGSGTTALVAARLGRHAILLEAKADYADLARIRILKDWAGPDERTRIGVTPGSVEDTPLFGGKMERET